MAPKPPHVRSAPAKPGRSSVSRVPAGDWHGGPDMAPKPPLGPRFHFFAGKGGVGKTTWAAAAAVGTAERKRRVLLVSTDPAHSLGDVLDRRLGSRPARVATRRGLLEAVELDADGALARWIGVRRRHLRTLPLRATYLHDDDIDRFLRLSLPGVDELIGLLELDRLAGARPYDDVVVDTAPTGHTLRLLAMPATLGHLAAVLDDMQGKHRFLTESLGGAERRDAADAVVTEIAGQSEALDALLRDPTRCAFTWLLLPEPLALEETRDGIAGLEADGIPLAEILINRVTPRPSGPCALCEARRDAEGAVIAATVTAFPGRAVRVLAGFHREPLGVLALRRVAALLQRAPAVGATGSVGRGHRVSREPEGNRRRRLAQPPLRSEERRGGKECRRGRPDYA